MYQPERSNELLGSRNLKEKLYRRNGNMRMGSVKQVQLINQSLTLRLQAVSIIFFFPIWLTNISSRVLSVILQLLNNAKIILNGSRFRSMLDVQLRYPARLVFSWKRLIFFLFSIRENSESGSKMDLFGSSSWSTLVDFVCSSLKKQKLFAKDHFWPQKIKRGHFCNFSEFSNIKQSI